MGRSYAEVAEGVARGGSGAALIPSIPSSDDNCRFDPASLDAMLGYSVSGGPVAQAVRQSRGKLIITFNDADQWQKAFSSPIQLAGEFSAFSDPPPPPPTALSCRDVAGPFGR